MKFRVLELCAGYGSQAMALKEIGLDVYSEIAEFDKYASQAYMQLHGETKNYGDIYTIDEKKLPNFDMITYSTPCQDFSIAGNQKGGEKGSGTRSSLLWECERIIRAVKPKYLLMENVKNLMSDKFRHTFNEWFGVLESMGYRNYYKVLNAKDYGVPQNRERIFCVSILGNEQFLFPNPIKLSKKLKDVLETEVNEKFYLTSDKTRDFIKTLSPEQIEKTQEISYCLDASYWKGASVKDFYQKHKRQLVVDTETLKIINNTSKGYDDALDGDSVSLDQPNSKTRRGRVGHQVSNTLTCSCNMGVVVIGENAYCIRRLTPRECWRLMGVPDEYFNRLHDISNTQLYKLAGNSIVVDVLKAIFTNLLKPEEVKTVGQLTLF